jgi:crotonobetainyl-CoA:carnitine CoA-transferase CaiB-like acyl-CoA transferase
MVVVNAFSALKLKGVIKGASDAFVPLITAVMSHANKMGVTFIESESTSKAQEIVFAIEDAHKEFELIVTAPIIDGEVCGEVELQAMTGLVSVHSRSLDRIVPIGVDYISHVSASLIIQQLLSGLIGRHRGSQCAKATFDMIQAGLLAVGQYLAGATTEQGAEAFPSGSSDPDLRPPFVSQDGVLFELESLNPSGWQGFWLALGVDAKQIGKGWHAFMGRYAKGVAPLPDSMVKVLNGRPYQYLAQVASQYKVAITPVRSLAERIRDKDVDAVLCDGPYSIEPVDCRPASYQALSDLTHESLLPLAGIKVVESCRRIQGPLAGHILALFGAEVIRIEPIGGDPLRDMPPLANGSSARFQALNARKEIIEVDIKSLTGKQQVASLVKEADVFVHNWAPGKAKALQLDEQHLCHINPSLVYAYAGGWGIADDHIALPGTDFMAQAYSGLAEIISQYSGVKGGTLFTATDVFGGVLAAQAIIMAMYCRVSGAFALSVGSSLLGAATLLTESRLQQEPDNVRMVGNADQPNDSASALQHYTDLSQLSSHPLTEPFLTTESYTQLSDLWRPL